MSIFWDILFFIICLKEGDIMEDYVFDMDDFIFNNPNRDIIKRIEFNSIDEFHGYCDSIIKSRISFMQKYNMINYNECLTSDIHELNTLQPIIIDGCFTDEYFIDCFLVHFENKYNLNYLKDKYGILIIDL